MRKTAKRAYVSCAGFSPWGSCGRTRICSIRGRWRTSSRAHHRICRGRGEAKSPQGGDVWVGGGRGGRRFSSTSLGALRSGFSLAGRRDNTVRVSVALPERTTKHTIAADVTAKAWSGQEETWEQKSRLEETIPTSYHTRGKPWALLPCSPVRTHPK